jgi:BASS family bile acid:Na+ symporter
MRNVARLIQEWMLPCAIVLGISLYLLYHATPALHGMGSWLHPVVSEGQRVVIALLLFFQFVKISPHDIKLSRWHLGALAVQVLAFLALAAGVAVTEGTLRMLLECGMLCMICPTASAAGVITDKLGGDLAATVSYVVLINLAATFLIPLVIPMVNPSATRGFWAYVGHIAWKVFPVLILPGLVAWIIRYTTHKLQRRLMRWAPNSFYIWGVGLTLAMILATRALMNSGLGWGAVAGIVGVSVFTCFIQFFAGRRMGRSRVESLTAGQALGQKNTGFLIWLGYNYMTPVTSVAGGLYAVWQNLFNSWELYQKAHEKAER